MKLNRSTLSEQIYKILRDDILKQTIPQGEKLTLATLKERFGVSSTPIREALTRLSEEGLLNYYSNVGVKVISLDRQDLIELYRFMGDLDRLAILYSAESADREEICREIRSCIQGTGIILEKSELTEEESRRWIEYSDRFHLLFYDYAGNRKLTHAATKLRGQLTIFSNLYETTADAQKSIHEAHTKIADFYLVGEVLKAGEQMKEHMEDSLRIALSYLKEDPEK